MKIFRFEPLLQLRLAVPTALFFVLAILASSCSEDPPPALPELTTKPITSASSTATAGGIITSFGDLPIIERGVEWSINPLPSEEDSTVISDADAESFDVEIGRFKAETTYYVRSYVKTQSQTVYGQQETFTTNDCNSPISDQNTDEACQEFINQAGGTAVCVSGATRVNPGDMIEYSFFSTLEDPQITWWVYSGSMNILSGLGTNSIIVKFEDNFEHGCLVYSARESNNGRFISSFVSIGLN